MKEEKTPKSKTEKKTTKPKAEKPKSEKPKAEKETTTPKGQKKTTKKGKETPKQETNSTTPQEISPIPPENKDLPTEQEIEALKEDILEHGLLNPYALILYNYMRVSTYETNVRPALSMRDTLLKINKINEIILNELTQD